MKNHRCPTSKMLWLVFLSLTMMMSWSVMAVFASNTSGAFASCSSADMTTLPLVLDGEGDFCYMTSGNIRFINSWNMQLVKINGVEYSNIYSDDMPERQNGKYYIHYVGAYPWSHLEVIGSGGSDEKIPVTGISVRPDQVTIPEGAIATLTATIIPDNATEKNIRWLSSDAGIASVNDKGVVKGVSEGHVTITATTTDGGFQTSSSILVEGSVDPEKSYTLTISASGGGTTDPAVGSHTYPQGTTVRVMASASAGTTFSGWSGAASGSKNPVYVTVNSDLELIASFSDDSILPDECDGACNAATPVYPTITDDGGIGNVTMYSTSSSQGGACNYGATDVMYYAAINAHVVPGDHQGNWQGGTACGQCAEVTVVTSEGPRKVVVRIMDKCPDGHCGIDLGGAAPGDLMIDGFGRYQGQWRLVSCDGHPEVSDGPPTIDVFAGSNRWWSRVNVRNGSAGVDHIEWQTPDGSKKGTFPLAQDPENTYEVPVNDVLHANTAEFVVTVHYTDGSTATARLSPNELATSGSYPLD